MVALTKIVDSEMMLRNEMQRKRNIILALVIEYNVKCACDEIR